MKLPSPFGTTPPKTTLELTIDKLTATLRSKPKWPEKVLDSNIVSKWKQEAIDTGLLSEEAFEFALKQMQHYATLGASDGTLLSSVLGVYQNDTILTPDLTSTLTAQLAPLENVPEAEQDWHPGSEQRVLDVVHPSLFCLVYGTTRRIPAEIADDGGFNTWRTLIGTGEIVPPPTPAPARRNWTDHHSIYSSDKFQWLPSEVAVDETGCVKFTSYINNLHPRHHEQLYGTLERLLGDMLPLFECTLADSAVYSNPLISVDMYSIHEEPGSDLSDDAYDDFYENRQVVNPPKVPEIYTPAPLPNAGLSLRSRTLQVIVKVAEIVLTPERPDYPGGAWHVEGMENEKIVATGIAYVAADNITPSELHFRRSVGDPDYEQNDNAGVKFVYGLEDEGPLNQAAGSVACEAGRCLCFPNAMQHRVAPFELLDKSRSGFRKIVVFFLVHPDTPVISTRVVPAQQRKWWHEEVRLAKRFPGEIVDAIDRHMEFPLSWKAACEHRTALMEERSVVQGRANEEYYEREFSLCEH